MVSTELYQTWNALRLNQRLLLFSLQSLANALAVELPGDPKSIGSNLVQEARGRFAVKVNLVSVRKNSELSEIEISVQTLKRIEGPGDPFDALRQNSIALDRIMLKANLR